MTLKGVAILMMLWHHLFWSEHYTIFYTLSGLTLSGKPLEVMTGAFCDPVMLFVFISGYGLYKSYARSQRSVSATSVQSFVGNIKRGLRLYIHYWITLAIFLPIAGYMFGYERYPQSLHFLLLHLIGIATTYNTEVWFLLPYVLLMVFSGVFYKFISRWHWAIGLAFALALHIAQTTEDHFFVHITYQQKPMFLAFLLGMIAAKTVDSDKMRAFFKDRVLLGYTLLLGVCLLFGVSLLCLKFVLLLSSGLIRPFFAAAFCILFASLPHTAIVDKVLVALGKRSTSMWFIHSWFCYTLCHDFIYSFKYAIPIFLVLVIISYVCSIPIDYIHSRLLHLLHLAKK